MNVVVDTNVLVSGIFWGGKPGDVLAYWRDGKVNLLATIDTIEEYLRVVAKIGKHESDLVEEWSALLWRHVVLVEKSINLTNCRDPHDNMFLGGADCVVSGDHDLLVLGSIRGIPIVKVAEFLSLLR